MKKLFAFTIALVSFLSVNAHNFNHTIGLVYNQFNGIYGNMDLAGVMYNPQIQKIKGNYSYGMSFPLSYLAGVSSARSEVQKGFFELPASFEVSYTPCGLCNSYQFFSVFAGAGMSRLYQVNQVINYNDYYNATLGIRMPVSKKSIEVRMNYSSNIQFQKNRRLNLSIGYTL
ncbi:MAG: hypothetical protein IT245_01740 [Bacteroidia bacterium]|nr:hypothetical protein [Bacteroidia bacterium]